VAAASRVFWRCTPLAALPRLAATCTRALQHGSLPGYATLAIGACTGSLAMAFLAMARGDSWTLGPREPMPGLGVVGAAALIVAGALGALLSTQRLLLLLTSGMVGYGSAVLFLFTGAPDLAFTQFAVETVFVIVVACVLLALAREGRPLALDERRWRLGHAALAAGFATVLTGLLLAVAATPLDDTLSRAFSEMSVPLANGRNVVNVILVDFRALDTLGEISVVLLSLLAAVPLLQGLYAAATSRGKEAP
jgi:multicomponent Na+:H+ antiporter subunit A